MFLEVTLLKSRAAAVLENPFYMTMEVFFMAIFKCSYRLVDAKGKRQTVLIPVPRGALTLADITGFMAAQAPLIDAITEAQVDSMAIEIGVTKPGGLKAAAIADSDCEEGGNLSFSCTGTDYAFSVRIPALVQALFAGSDVDMLDALLTPFTASMVAGLLVGAVQVNPSNPYENDIAGVLAGSKSFRK
jgi:hypothetical protein